MKKFHLVFGVLVIIVFVLTGQYMDRYHEHLRGMADGPRMLFRSRHIFILLSGLLHLGLGAYWRNRLTPPAPGSAVDRFSPDNARFAVFPTRIYL